MKFTEEHKRKLSEAHKNKKHSEFTKHKISQSMIDYHLKKKIEKRKKELKLQYELFNVIE